MNLDGYAFNKNGKELQETYQEIYQQALQYKDQIEITKVPAYGQGLFEGKFLTQEAKENLSELAVALLADNGNLCFGGHCTITGDRFQGAYWTD